MCEPLASSVLIRFRRVMPFVRRPSMPLDADPDGLNLLWRSSSEKQTPIRSR